ncbi:hypothetical protein [Propionicicella superfundia]|uniref:hypothetical protein n=1 Tax=Propionicicella superfundia TaxID=348582 RepID=UPI00042A51FD|nr:hypothetical protein [Propionicicella superfundia]
MRSSIVPLAKATGAIALAATLSLGLAGCGFDVQTLQVDSPGQGVNTDAGQVKIRDIALVATGEHTARVTGAVTSPAADRLVSVDGHPFTPDGDTGTAFRVTGAPIAVPAGDVLDLTFGTTGIMVTSPDLTAGYSAELTFTFASGASATVQTLILDTEAKDFSSVTPVPPATTSATPSTRG